MPFTLFSLTIEAQREKHTLLRKAAKRKRRKRRISRSAERDRRSTAPDSCRLLEKAGENFNYTKCVRFI